MGVINAIASKWAGNSRGANQGWGGRRENGGGGRRENSRRDHGREFSELGGDYLHFTLYKENKDTMDAMNTIARLLKIKASNFGFAGTKDRRAATVQRISVYHQRASNLIWLNTRIPNVKVGDFEYLKEPLQLGQHGGNEFVITLKNCQPLGGDNCSLAQRMKMIQQAVECGLAYLKHNGYINYYGLQRFGTYSIGTHLLGMKILKGDYEGFIEDVLHVEEDLIKEVLTNAPQPYGPAKDAQNARDDQNRARAITAWKTTKNATKALEFLPKRFSSEAAIIRHLGKNQKDFTGAVLSITRGMRMMYVHAYQSYVWNFVATRRWSKYGAKVIEGDLVLITGTRRRDNSDDEFNPYDDDDGDNIYAQAHALTAADVASGKYTIFDVVLPTPGYDVLYPRNEIGEYYVEFMGKPENGALSPFEMRRKQREFSLSGNYRSVIGRLIGDPQYAVRAYRDDTEQMYPTDLDYATHKKNAETLAKLKATPLPPPRPALVPDADSIVNRYAHFAQNPAVYDDAMAAQRRRKADQEPPSPDVVVTNETWVQTGVDGSAKRVKLARHHQQIETANGASAGGTGPTNAVSEVEAPEEEDTDRTPFPVGNGASLTEDAPDNTLPHIITDGPIPMIALPKDAIPASGIRGVSDSYYASVGQIPYFGPLPEDYKQRLKEAQAASAEAANVSLDAAETPADAAAHTGEQQKPSATIMSEDGHKSLLDWYGSNLPQLPTVAATGAEGPTDGASQALVKVEDSDTAASGNNTEMINNVPVPELRTASDNPLSSVDNGIDEASIDPRANKIAVVLKFQLKASNYATIVLRELMGTTAEERAL